MKRFLAIVVLFLGISNVKAQISVPNYKQFFYNPYLYNSAYSTMSEETELYLTYRQQWLGFRDAPSVGALNMIVPVKSRVHLGLNVYSDKSVLVRNTGFMVTFGYTVPFSENQSLRFGMSGGLGQNRLDLTADELNTNDPAIINAADKNNYVNGNVGMVYQIKKFKIGVGINDIFNTNSFHTTGFNEVKLSNLSNRVYSISYKLDLGQLKKIEFEPYFIYRESSDDLQDYWEAASVFTYDKLGWLGGSYNNNGGFAAFLGMNIKKFGFSYSYEFPTIKSSTSQSSSSHELMVKFKFPNVGKPKKRKKSAPVVHPRFDTFDHEPFQRDTVSKPQPKPLFPPTGMVEPDGVKVKTDHREVIKQENVTYYVTIGVFTNEERAEKFISTLKIDHHVAYLKHNNMFYVYISASSDSKESIALREEIAKDEKFKDAWVFSVKN